MKNLAKAMMLLFFMGHFFIIYTFNARSLDTYRQEKVMVQLPERSKFLLNSLEGLVPNLPANLDFCVYSYGRLTGNESGYGFFSPNVPSVGSVFFEVKLYSGERLFLTPLMQSKEGIERFKMNFDWFREMEKARPLIARSWSVRMMEMVPRTEEIQVIVGMFDLPSMEEYKDGCTTTFDEHIRYHFRKAS
ncbi:MAG: hypothetical protein KDC44_02100 [Phaeodactylibacter sp.]|nr:hypothetical protein [Phaeodactylibacter sp.]